MFTLLVDDLTFEMKIYVRERLLYHTQEIHANDQHEAGNTGNTQIKSDLDTSIVHSSGNDEFDWHHALQFHIDGSLQSSSLHDLRTTDVSIHMNAHCHS
jgi:hypothetical protein